MEIKNIIREVPAEDSELSWYFDGDCFTGAAGDFSCNLFIIAQSRNCVSFNEKLYSKICNEIELLYDEYDCLRHSKENMRDPYYKNFSEIVRFNAHSERGGFYQHSLKNTRKLHELKKFLEWIYKPSELYRLKGRMNWDADIEGCVAKYLTIATGKQWAVGSARGHSQGDYVKMIYCEERHQNGVKHIGEIWLGAAIEFCIISIDDNGEESEHVYGFVVADSQAINAEEYKKLICEWDGINEHETRLEMIVSSRTIIKHEYKAVA